MKHSQKVKYIFLTCMLAIGVFSVIALQRSFRPSPTGAPYEEATLQQALEYMDYETGYCLLDVGDETAFDEWHLKGAVNVPYDVLLERSVLLLPDKSQMVYVYGTDITQAKKAAMKLTELGYTNVTLITQMDKERDTDAL